MAALSRQRGQPRKQEFCCRIGRGGTPRRMEAGTRFRRTGLTATAWLGRPCQTAPNGKLDHRLRERSHPFFWPSPVSVVRPARASTRSLSAARSSERDRPHAGVDSTRKARTTAGDGDGSCRIENRGATAPTTPKLALAWDDVQKPRSCGRPRLQSANGGVSIEHGRVQPVPTLERHRIPGGTRW